MTKNINFSQNWNGKLNCKFYTTIRLYQPNYYVENEMYKINLQEKYHHNGLIHSIYSSKIYDITDRIYMLDTGYKKQQAIELLQNMYKAKNIDWNTQYLNIILLENLSYKI